MYNICSTKAVWKPILFFYYYCIPSVINKLCMSVRYWMDSLSSSCPPGTDYRSQPPKGPFEKGFHFKKIKLPSKNMNSGVWAEKPRSRLTEAE